MQYYMSKEIWLTKNAYYAVCWLLSLLLNPFHSCIILNCYSNYLTINFVWCNFMYWMAMVFVYIHVCTANCYGFFFLSSSLGSFLLLADVWPSIVTGLEAWFGEGRKTNECGKILSRDAHQLHGQALVLLYKMDEWLYVFICLIQLRLIINTTLGYW